VSRLCPRAPFPRGAKNRRDVQLTVPAGVSQNIAHPKNLAKRHELRAPASKLLTEIARSSAFHIHQECIS